MNDNEILERAEEIKKEKAAAKKLEYIKKYDKNNTISKTLKFNKNTDKILLII